MNKTLQDLTLKNSFMFAAVMTDAENCKALLERVLEIEIDHVVVDKEKSFVYHPEYKSVRLDVYAKDEEGSHFNVEMQVAKKEIVKRARYYHSQLDMNLLLAGMDYENLPNCYVIFICDYDPFGLEKYRYTVKSSFLEDESFSHDDGSYTVFLNTKGKNRDEVPKELVAFLEYAGADREQAEMDFHDEYVRRLQETVAKIRQDREMGVRYMLFSELLQDEFLAGETKGKAEGKAYSTIMVLNVLGDVPEELASKIRQVTDAGKQDELLKLAATSTSVEEFAKKAGL